MPSDRKPSLILPVAVILAVLLGLYVGDDRLVFRPFYVAPWDSEWSFEFNDRATLFFTPIHSLDRRIRPHVWEPTP
jgi:hypothetical protein